MTVVSEIGAEVVLVGDRLDADAHHARRSVDDRVRVIATGSDAGRGDERLDARARLEDVGGRAIAIARGGNLIAIVRVVRRLVHHREHFARVDVEHDDGAALRLLLLHRRLQLAIREILNPQVDARDQVFAGPRRADALDIFDGAAIAVLDHALLAGLRAEPAVVGELEPFLADVVVLLGEAEQVAGDFARRIEALILAQQIHAWDLQLRDVRCIARPHVAHQVDELAIEIAGDDLRQPLLVAVERFGETRNLIRGAHHFRRAGPHGVDGRARRQRLAVAVIDAAADRGEFRDAREACIALPFEESFVEQLQIDGTRDQRDRDQHDRAEHQAQPRAELLLRKAAVVIVADHRHLRSALMGSPSWASRSGLRRDAG